MREDEFCRSFSQRRLTINLVLPPGPSSSSPNVQASSSPPAAAVTPPAGDAENAKVERLMALGFPRDQCLAVLKMAGGNEEYAAGVLFEMQ